MRHALLPHEQAAVWNALLERIQQATIHFLKVLVAAGADVYQLFDSWAGMLERADYLRWAQPHHQAILREVTGVPRILFVKEGPADLLADSGADVISLGKSHDLRTMRAGYPHLTFQGNVDESLLRRGTSAQVVEATKKCLEAGEGRRHILNLSHGVDKATPVENFEAFVQTAKDFRG